MSKRPKKANQIPVNGGRMAPFQFERPALSGRYQLTVVPVFDTAHPKSRIDRPVEGGRGFYRFSFSLCLPGGQSFLPSIDFDQMLQKGTSLLTVPKEVQYLKIELSTGAEQVEVRLYTNGEGILARGELHVLASNFVEAETTALDLVLPMLSWWCYNFDVPIDIGTYQLFEESTDITKVNAVFPGKACAFNLANHRSEPEHRLLLSAYREAVNALNPFYQALSYWRVIEGVYKARDLRRAEATRRGDPIRQPNERLPATVDELALPDRYHKEYFEPYLGLKYTVIIKERLRDTLRNAIAHLDPERSVLLSADRYEDLVTCERAVPVLRYISRVLLAAEVAGVEMPAATANTE